MIHWNTWLLFLALATTSSSTRVKRYNKGTPYGQNGQYEGEGEGGSGVRGMAGVDYPAYYEIPQTSFSCQEQAYPGWYADLETQCQVYHVCHNGRKESFLCGIGTVFNQQILTCDYWYSADCDSSPNFYYLNAAIGDSQSQNLGPGDQQPPRPGPSYGGGQPPRPPNVPSPPRGGGAPPPGAQIQPMNRGPPPGTRIQPMNQGPPPGAQIQPMNRGPPPGAQIQPYPDKPGPKGGMPMPQQGGYQPGPQGPSPQPMGRPGPQGPGPQRMGRPGPQPQGYPSSGGGMMPSHKPGPKGDGGPPQPGYQPGPQGPSPQPMGRPAPQPGYQPGPQRPSPQPMGRPAPQQGYQPGPQSGYQPGPQGPSPQPMGRPGPQPSYQKGPQPGYQPGPQPGPQSMGRPGPQPGYQPGPQPGPQGPGPQPGYQPGPQGPAPQPMGRPGPQPGYQPGPQPGPQGPGPQPGYQPGPQGPAPQPMGRPGPQPGYQQPGPQGPGPQPMGQQPGPQQQGGYDKGGSGGEPSGVRGTAGVDYPNYTEIPNTSFKCLDQPSPGYYADVDTQCQVYHVCHDGRKESLLCGIGTMFNQQILACDFWYSVDCEASPSFYHLNAAILEAGQQAHNFKGTPYQSPQGDQTQGQGSAPDGTWIKINNLNKQDPGDTSQDAYILVLSAPTKCTPRIATNCPFAVEENPAGSQQQGPPQKGDNGYSQQGAFNFEAAYAAEGSAPEVSQRQESAVPISRGTPWNFPSGSMMDSQN